MNKELAEEIARISLQEMDLANKKWVIQKKLDGITWDEAKTMAMQFLLENKNA